jgi:hypothetical protein
MNIKLQEPNNFFKSVSLCYICKKKANKYICPKCSIPYCSLICYKSHNPECLEDFYKEQVIQSLKSRKSTKEEKRKISEMIQKADQTPDLIMKDIQEDLELKRLQQILSLAEHENFIDGLTDSEKQDFLSFINSGKVLKHIQEWVPWWIDQNKDFCIEISSDPFYIQLPKIESLCKNPSQFLLNHCLEVIWHSVFAFRMFNGEIDEHQEDILRVMMNNSKVIRGDNLGQEFEDAISVIRTSAESALNSQQDLATGLVVAVTHDSHLILSSKWKTAKFFLDLLKFLQRPDVKKFFVLNSKKRFSALCKKFEFFLAFVKSKNLCSFNLISGEVLKFLSSPSLFSL